MKLPLAWSYWLNWVRPWPGARMTWSAPRARTCGAPCTIAALEVDLAVEHLKTMAEEVPYVQGKAPYGTVAAIFPYDAPPIMLARVGGAAILGGNRFRFSCSSMTPRSARILQEVVAPFAEIEAVTGMTNQDFGRRCVRRPRRQGPVHLRRRGGGRELRPGGRALR